MLALTRLKRTADNLDLGEYLAIGGILTGCGKHEMMDTAARMPDGLHGFAALAIARSSPTARLGASSVLLTVVFAAASVTSAPAQDGDTGFDPVVTAAEGVSIAQPPRPKVEPTVPAPANKTPAAGAKKPPSRAGEPLDDTPPRPLPARRNIVPDLGLLAFRTPSLRLASVPNMLGDFFGQGGQIQKTGQFPSPTADFPAAGGGRRFKVAENNKALPMNRVYFTYHHFHNALTFDPGTLMPGGPQDASVGRYTIGLERTFADDQWSVDIRMPFYETYQATAPGFQVQAGEIGNLSVAIKRLIAASDDAALAAGLGVETPTGSNAISLIDTSTIVTQHNQAVHLSPYVGYLRLPTDACFYHAFLQLDVPLNGNSVGFVDPVWNQSGMLGTLNDQTLLHVDLSVGHWLYRNPDAPVLTGIASLVEFHYLTTLQDADTFNTVVLGNPIQLGILLNRVDMANITVGLHASLFGNTTLRVGSVFPLQNSAERPFDAEINVSLNRYY